MASNIAHLVFALVVVMAVGRLLAPVCKRVGQPGVIGEVIGGILLGPSLLGLVWPAGYAFLLPASVAPWLATVATIGVVLYMFLVGLELDAGALRGQLRSTVTIAGGSMAIRFALGLLLAHYLYESLAPAGISRLSFGLFMGIAMSIVAFPVLARILSETGLIKSELGARALAVSAVADLVAWCVLAVVIGIVQATPDRAFRVTVAAVTIVVVILGVLRPVFTRVTRSDLGREAPPYLTVGVVALLFAVAWASSRAGVHAIAAGFLFGAAIPHDSALARTMTRHLDRFVSIVLLPAFFAYVGMKTEIGLVSGAADWMVTGLIILVAAVGSYGATYLVARLVGRPARESSALGVLMNTRGLMELVVLNIGLELGVISPTLFAMMVIMALVTTMMTTPVLKRVL